LTVCIIVRPRARGTILIGIQWFRKSYLSIENANFKSTYFDFLSSNSNDVAKANAKNSVSMLIKSNTSITATLSFDIIHDTGKFWQVAPHCGGEDKLNFPGIIKGNILGVLITGRSGQPETGSFVLFVQEAVELRQHSRVAH
jgi:hypothetical protein